MTQVKIFKELWTASETATKSKPAPLAYMCQKTNDAGFKKRRNTGMSWARKGGENTYDNKPVSGFKIGKSVSRWSTSNKLIRVSDPRGFTVELSISCFATLLEDVTITKGVIKDKCVWGRMGPENVLISVNSQEYKDSIKLGTSGKQDFIPMKNVKVGDCVEVLSHGNKVSLVYAGRKGFKVELDEYVHEYRGGYRRNDDSVKTLQTSRPVHLFNYPNSKRSMIQIAKPNILSIGKNDMNDAVIDTDNIWVFELPGIKSNYNSRYNMTKGRKIVEILD